MYVSKTDKESMSMRTIVMDDMILTKEFVTTAGSKMLEDYKCLFDAEVYTRLLEAGYEIIGKSKNGEFAIDLLGETSKDGAIIKDGVIKNASAEILKTEDVVATIDLDVNGAIRRAASQNKLFCIKPTYGTVSRYGVIPVACSGDTICVTARNLESCQDVLSTIVGHDDKDGTSVSEEKCNLLKKSEGKLEFLKVAVLNSMMNDVSSEIADEIESFSNILTKNGVCVESIDGEIIKKSRIAWNILMCAELCNNVSRYDGVKFGYRAKTFSNIDELYTNSRTEAFGELLKTAILFGSSSLSTQNYFEDYDKALRVRRVIVEEFKKLFKDYDAVIIPTCSTKVYTQKQIEENNYVAFEENLYTAPASITGLPALIAGGIQIIGSAFSETKLFELAKIYEKEGK